MNTSRKGFALVTAILILALVAGAIAALAATMSADGLRTLNRSRDAQLEQLLLAGAADAAEHLKSTTPMHADQSWSVDLPPGIADEISLKVSVKSLESDRAKLLVEASINKNRRAGQTLTYERADTGWKLASAALGGD